jgi:hypothetical protein
MIQASELAPEVRHQVPPPTPPAQPTRPKKTTPDKSGCLIFKAKGIMPTIDQPDTKKRICAGHARDGVVCKQGQRCPMIHNNNPTTWSPATAKAWLKLVEDTPELEWHHTVDVEQLKARCNEA